MSSLQDVRPWDGCITGQSDWDGREIPPDLSPIESVVDELIEVLQTIRRGMTSEKNNLWPTTKKWTKKERDESIVRLIDSTLRKAHVRDCEGSRA